MIDPVYSELDQNKMSKTVQVNWHGLDLYL